MNSTEPEVTPAKQKWLPQLIEVIHDLAKSLPDWQKFLIVLLLIGLLFTAVVESGRAAGSIADRVMDHFLPISSG